MVGHGGRRDGAGRPKGVPNKLNGDIKAMILGALQDVGGQQYLAQQAYENPVAFMGLVAKVLPLQLQGSGPDGALELIVTGVRRAIEQDDAPVINHEAAD